MGGGGDKTDQAAEQQQQQFDSQLMQIFQQQYANQTSIQTYLKNQVQPQITAGGQGYTPAQLAAQRTGATDTNAQQFQQAQQALAEQTQQASGGSKLTGVAGATQENVASLNNSEALANANAQENITTNNANLQQQNYWNAMNVLNGVAAQENPLGYAGSATSGTGAVAGASNANTNAINASNGPLDAVIGAVGGAAGGLLGNPSLKL